MAPLLPNNPYSIWNDQTIYVSNIYPSLHLFLYPSLSQSISLSWLLSHYLTYVPLVVRNYLLLAILLASSFKLQRNNPNYSDIKRAVIELDEEYLSMERLIALRSIVPSEEERTLLLSYQKRQGTVISYSIYPSINRNLTLLLLLLAFLPFVYKLNKFIFLICLYL